MYQGGYPYLQGRFTPLSETAKTRYTKGMKIKNDMINSETVTPVSNGYQYEQSFKTKAMAAAIALHNQLANDDAFGGYDADKDAFDRLYREVYAITRYELFDGADCEQIVETWFCYFEEILNGERDLDWFEYV